MAYLRKGTKRASRSCILQGKLCSGRKPQPESVLAQDRSACLVLTYPRLPIGPRRVWAASGSVGTAAWLGSPQLETKSKHLLLRGEG